MRPKYSVFHGGLPIGDKHLWLYCKRCANPNPCASSVGYVLRLRESVKNSDSGGEWGERTPDRLRGNLQVLISFGTPPSRNTTKVVYMIFRRYRFLLSS